MNIVPVVSYSIKTHLYEISAMSNEKPLAEIITNFLLFLAIFLLSLDGDQLIFLSYLNNLRLIFCNVNRK